jgi:hypothetical protein
MTDRELTLKACQAWLGDKQILAYPDGTLGAKIEGRKVALLPLEKSGQAFDMAVTLGIEVQLFHGKWVVFHGVKTFTSHLDSEPVKEKRAKMRRAIVRMAALIGEGDTQF